ncbi:MAG: acylphosphatase, partial [Archaeoglobaceae archaeon]
FQIEHWGKAIPIMLNMLEKQDLMLEKQDLVINKLDETKQELGSKIDQTREDLAERLDETNAKLELLRSDLRDYLEKNMKELNARILRIEEALRKAGLM